MITFAAAVVVKRDLTRTTDHSLSTHTLETHRHVHMVTRFAHHLTGMHVSKYSTRTRMAQGFY